MWGSIGFAVSSLAIGEVLNQVGIQYIMWPYLAFGVITLLAAFKLTDVQATDTPLQLSDLKHLLRSEEHTSELQSRGHLVCRLLLEKKKHEQIARSHVVIKHDMIAA